MCFSFTWETAPKEWYTVIDIETIPIFGVPENIFLAVVYKHYKYNFV